MNKKVFTFEKEINKIREELYTESKGLTAKQRADKGNAAAKVIADKYGLVFADSAKTQESKFVAL